jgi:hypothetical protein
MEALVPKCTVLADTNVSALQEQHICLVSLHPDGDVLIRGFARNSAYSLGSLLTGVHHSILRRLDGAMYSTSLLAGNGEFVRIVGYSSRCW